jgi:ParB family chromosome partitioning protein
VTNTIRLLQLPGDVQRLLAEGAITAGHARALLGLEDAEAQIALAVRIAGEGLSVRQTEDLVRTYAAAPEGRPAQEAKPLDPMLLQYEETLAEALGTRVHIQRSRRKGKILVEFGSKADLGRIVSRILQGA